MNDEAVNASPSRLVKLGEIVGTHGVGGLLRLHPYSDCSAALAAVQHVFLTPKAPHGCATGPGNAPDARTARSVRLTSARPHGRVMLLRVAGIDSIEAAAPLLGTILAVDEEDLPPAAPGEIYAYRLSGLEVWTFDGKRLGRVQETFDTGSSEVLVVRDGGNEHLVPVIADVIRSIDVAGGRIVIDPLPGLLD